MDNFLLILSLAPLIGLNVWHSLLLARRSKDGRPRTISEHAVETVALLRTHRLMHSLSSVLMVSFALGYLLPEGYSLAACFLIAAAIFDVLEVTSLNKQTALVTIRLNSHVVTAWTMALFYLLYATVIIPVVELNSLFVVAAWLAPAVLALVFKLRGFNGFWIAQHLYFCILALVLATAHVRLLVG